MDGGRKIGVEDVFGLIAGNDDIEGVTISGGEPFLQLDALHTLLKRIRAETSLSVIIYTGFTYDELRGKKDERIDEIIEKYTDILIDGPYIDELNDGKSLRGSSNQIVHFITDRYEDMRNLFGTPNRSVEVRITNDKLTMIGVPDRKTLEKISKLANTIIGPENGNTANT